MRIFKPRGFQPHCFETEVEFTGEAPWVLVDWKALRMMWYYVDLCDQEISWLGTVKKLELDYLIDEVFLFEQTVSGAQTTLEANDIAKVVNKLIRQGEAEKANQIRFWGHSHVFGGTGPSTRDNEQMEKDFGENLDLDFMLRGIFNKKGRAEFTIYEYNLGRIIHDAVWDIYQPDGVRLRRKAKREMEQKVKRQVSTYVFRPPETRVQTETTGVGDKLFQKMLREKKGGAENE